MSDIAIQVENLGKMFHIAGSRERYKTFRDTLAGFFTNAGGRKKAKDEPFWALKNVSFEIKRGEVVGVIGRNGAGKSTLLKVLSRITDPTEGYAEIHGRVGSLLEVGTGFHPELSGRENVFLNGAILGMARSEITKKFAEIVEFSEVQKFIETPVKHYSSGMYLRLAFAVAAYMETDILLVDEVLAVGDMQFQQKCLGKMQDVSQGGRTVLFVSHNLGSMLGLCKNGLVLDKGRIVFAGPISEAVAFYSAEGPKRKDYSCSGSRTGTHVRAARIIGPEAINSGEGLEFEVIVWADQEREISIDWRLKDERGAALIFGCPHFQFGLTHRLKLGLNTFVVNVGHLPLAQGNYSISIDLDVPWSEYLERVENCLEFQVVSCLVGSRGHSLKSSWGRGSLVIPFEIRHSD